MIHGFTTVCYNPVYQYSVMLGFVPVRTAEKVAEMRPFSIYDLSVKGFSGFASIAQMPQKATKSQKCDTNVIQVAKM